MKKHLTLFIIVLSFFNTYSQVNDSLKTDSVAKSQNQAPKTNKDTRTFKEKFALGLGTSFWITPSQTYVEVTPALAYRFRDRRFPKALVAGIGYRYIYRHDRVWGRDLNAWGPNVFGRFNLLRSVYFWTQYEILQNEHLTQVGGTEVSKSTQTTDSWFAGLGFMRSIGRNGRGGISLQILYNFLYDRDDRLYYSPVTYHIGYFF